MRNLTFDRDLLLVMFTQINPGVTSATEEEIARFDKQLKAANEPDLSDIMRANGVAPINSLTKAQILAYKPNMPGNTPELQIANACTFFLNTQEAVPAAAPAKRAAPSKGKTRSAESASRE